MIILPKYVGQSTHILNNSNDFSSVMVPVMHFSGQAKDTTMDICQDPERNTKIETDPACLAKENAQEAQVIARKI